MSKLPSKGLALFPSFIDSALDLDVFSFFAVTHKRFNADLLTSYLLMIQVMWTSISRMRRLSSRFLRRSSVRSRCKQPNAISRLPLHWPVIAIQPCGSFGQPDALPVGFDTVLTVRLRSEY
jgi:hypothetical protein